MTRFAVVNVLGNDLPPRHHRDQTWVNLNFILNEERPLQEASRMFCLNRIVDQVKVAAYRELLRHHGCVFVEIPFDQERCKSLPVIKQVEYATNVNVARNVCIEYALTCGYEVAVVLDGAAFLRHDGWLQFVNMVDNYPGEGVYAMGVHRAESFQEVRESTFSPQLRECYKFGGDQIVWGTREPYLAFTGDADVRFDENLVYGRCDKAELLFRLGVPGVWERWEPGLLKAARTKMSKWAGSVKWAGYAVRLPSHDPSGDGDNRVRGAMRVEGLRRLLSEINST